MVGVTVDVRDGETAGRVAYVVATAVDRTLRVLLLVVLAVTGTLALAGGLPTDSDPGRLVADLRAGRVDSITYRPGADQVRWSTRWWRWYSADVLSPGSGNSFDGGTLPGHDLEATPPDVSGTREIGIKDVRREARLADRPVSTVDDDNDLDWVWADDLHTERLRDAATGAWTLTFLMMLFSRRRTFANRWAWFWMFTLGQVGALLYLVLDPDPIWRRPRPYGAAVPIPEHVMRGDSGCLAALITGVGIPLVGAIVLMLVGGWLG